VYLELELVFPTCIQCGHALYVERKISVFKSRKQNKKQKTPQYNWNIVECGVKHHKPSSQKFNIAQTPVSMPNDV
jgi:hypothetical protein